MAIPSATLRPSDPGPRSPPRSPSSTLRTIAGPLLIYHALLLGGAFLLIRGNVLGSLPSLLAGAALIVGGIAVEIAILYWAAGLIRASARSHAVAEGTDSVREVAPVTGRWLCTVYGWKGDSRRQVCPRCGRLMIRISGR